MPGNLGNILHLVRSFSNSEFYKSY